MANDQQREWYVNHRDDQIRMYENAVEHVQYLTRQIRTKQEAKTLLESELETNQNLLIEAISKMDAAERAMLKYIKEMNHYKP